MNIFFQKIFRKRNKKIKELYKRSKNIVNPNYIHDNSYEEFFVDTGDLKFKYDNNNNFSSEKNNDGSNQEIITVDRRYIKIIKRKRKKDRFINLNNRYGYIIELKNVSKDYIVGKNKIVKILNNLNIDIKKGEFVILFGKSGSGKSTLLNIMSGLDRATLGNVVVANTNLPYLSNEQLTKFRRQNVAFIFQQYHLLNNITGYENVETGAILQKNKKDIDIKKLFEEFDLLDVMNKYPSQMSGGQQQRISIMRAIAKDANIIFADEPTSALDKNTSVAVMELLRKINKEYGTTIVMVSHDPNMIKYASRKIFLNKGKIVSDEKVEG
ncbi:MAG: ABC transporter ATP-binding protein [Mycoplasma sp.]|nr:ABC transporter ATP-binding protein [Mycoplasma sp.]